MSLGRAWMRELSRASLLALTAPGAIVAALVVLALSGGFASLGSLGQTFAGPAVPTSLTAAAAGVPRGESRLLARLPVAASQSPHGAALPAAGPPGSAPATAPGGSAPPTTGPGQRQPGGRPGRHGGSGGGSAGTVASSPAPPPPASPVDRLVGAAAVVTGTLPGPVGSAATQAVESVGKVLDGTTARPPFAGGSATGSLASALTGPASGR
jgi:hypothetical protein